MIQEKTLGEWLQKTTELPDCDLFVQNDSIHTRDGSNTKKKQVHSLVAVQSPTK